MPRSTSLPAPRFFVSAAGFRTWLETHAETAGELLVGFHKVDSGRPCMTWSASVDEALCVGWIDGVRRRIDDASYSIRFSPRRPGSIWSAVNIAKVEALRQAGRMRPAGLAAFALRTEARSAVYAHERIRPAELDPGERALFQRDAAAWTFFEATPPGYRQALLHWVTTAKKADTRAARLARLIAASAAGERMR